MTHSGVSLESSRRLLLPRILAAVVACLSGAAAAGLQEGLSAYRSKNYSVAFRELAPFASQGNAEAQFDLANMYRAGNGVERDDARALDWYQKAAAQGHAKAQYNLGAMYMSGRGTKQNYIAAASWTRKSAEQGFALAQYAMSDFYFKGLGVAIDDVAGAQWLRKAADQGLPEAESNMGAIYIDGRGVPKDAARAVTWLEKAAAHGVAAAQSNLGMMYYRGNGVPASYDTALSWFKRAAQGNEEVGLLALANDRRFNALAQHFKGACLASLSENDFRSYFGRVGGKVSDMTPKVPFSIAAQVQIHDSRALATYYRAPPKCCLSVFLDTTQPAAC